MTGAHCSCGVTVKASQIQGLDQCTSACSGDSSVKCGNGASGLQWDWSIYNITNCQATTTTTTSSTTTCLIEENFMYPGGGNDLNNGQASPRQNDYASCKSYCKSNHPTAKYFEWHSTSSVASSMHKICYCKASNANKYTATWGGTFNGEVDCGGEYGVQDRQNVVHMNFTNRSSILLERLRT